MNDTERTNKLKTWWERDRVPVILNSKSSDLEDINAAIQMMLEDYKTVTTEDKLKLLNRDMVPKRLTSVEEGDIYKPMEKEASMQRKTAEGILVIRRKVAELGKDITNLVKIHQKHLSPTLKKEAGKGLTKLMLALSALGAGGFLGAKTGTEALMPNSGSKVRELTNKAGITTATPGEDFGPKAKTMIEELKRGLATGEYSMEDYEQGIQNIKDQAADELAQKQFLEREARRFAEEDAAEAAVVNATKHHVNRQAEGVDSYLNSLKY